jgi:hypothetical protein
MSAKKSFAYWSVGDRCATYDSLRSIGLACPYLPFDHMGTLNFDDIIDIVRRRFQGFFDVNNLYVGKDGTILHKIWSTIRWRHLHKPGEDTKRDWKIIMGRAVPGNQRRVERVGIMFKNAETVVCVRTGKITAIQADDFRAILKSIYPEVKVEIVVVGTSDDLGGRIKPISETIDTDKYYANEDYKKHVDAMMKSSLQRMFGDGYNHVYNNSF